MADLKISALTASTTPLTGTEILPIVQSSTTKQVSVANLTAGRNVSVSQLGAGVASPATVLDTAGSTGSALNFRMSPSGWNTLHRVGVQYTGNGSVWSNNALMTSGTAGNLDDVTNSGSALLLNTSGNLSYVTASAGANPRTFTNRWTADSSGDFTVSTGNLAISTSGKGISLSGGITWTSGSGSPEGVVTAPIGSIYSRSDGGVLTSFYVKQSGTGNTGWAGK